MDGMTDCQIFLYLQRNLIMSVISVDAYSICRRYECAIKTVEMICALSVEAAISIGHSCTKTLEGF